MCPARRNQVTRHAHRASALVADEQPSRHRLGCITPTAPHQPTGRWGSLQSGHRRMRCHAGVLPAHRVELLYLTLPASIVIA
jgi:hypothetical protein